jgi:hypothetical protein
MSEDNRKKIDAAWDAAFQQSGAAIPIGDIVLCDDCNADWTGRKESGGLVFGSKGICPDCEPRWRASIAQYHEQDHISAECPEIQSFADFIREFRGPDSFIMVRSGPIR